MDFKMEGNLKHLKFVSIVLALIHNSCAQFFKEESNPFLGRTIGGELAKKSEAGFLVSLQSSYLYNRHYCGGTILSPYWILTSAYCIQGSAPTDIRVVAGKTRILKIEKSEQVRSVSKWIFHPSYSIDNNDYNVGLLKLSEPFDMSESSGLFSLTLAPENFLLDYNENALVFGWGQELDNYKEFGKVFKASIPLVRPETCFRRNTLFKPSHNTICAGATGKGVCENDEGATLICTNENQKIYDVVCGILSWSVDCAREGYPALYTGIWGVRDWIINTMNE